MDFQQGEEEHMHVCLKVSHWRVCITRWQKIFVLFSHHILLTSLSLSATMLRRLLYLAVGVMLTYMQKIYAIEDDDEHADDGELIVNLEPQSPEEIGEDIGEEPADDEEETFRDEEQNMDDEDWVDANNADDQKITIDTGVGDQQRVPQQGEGISGLPPPPIKPPVEATLEEEELITKQPLGAISENRWREEEETDNRVVPAPQPRPDANAENGWNEGENDAALADTPEPATESYDETIDETLNKAVEAIGTPPWYDRTQEDVSPTLEGGESKTSVDSQGRMLASPHGGSSSFLSFVFVVVILIIFLRAPQIKASIEWRGSAAVCTCAYTRICVASLF